MTECDPLTSRITTRRLITERSEVTGPESTSRLKPEDDAAYTGPETHPGSNPRKMPYTGSENTSRLKPEEHVRLGKKMPADT